MHFDRKHSFIFYIFINVLVVCYCNFFIIVLFSLLLAYVSVLFLHCTLLSSRQIPCVCHSDSNYYY